MPQRPLCFVLMPFGAKPDPSGGPDIDFDRIYTSAIRPGIEGAGMQPIRADEEELGGIIHRAMFERLLVCSYALADLTTSNANVLYELGVRHTARPGTTLTLYAASTPLPFDVKLLRAVPYELGPRNAFTDAEAAALRSTVEAKLATLLTANQHSTIRDSPLYQLLPGWDPPELSGSAAESCRAEARETQKIKDELDRLRVLGLEEGQVSSVRDGLLAIRSGLVDGTPDTGLFVKVMLVHRSISDWSGMLEVGELMPDDLQRQVPIRQQRAFAYNRRSEAALDSGDSAAAAQDRSRAVAILESLETEQGPTSETSGLLGRTYKSQWLRARDQGHDVQAIQFLHKALDAYRRGFYADWSDVYPGVNTATLLEARGGQAALEEQARLLPIVRFAAEQRLRAANPSYWDHASLLELLVLLRADDAADAKADDVQAAHSEGWQTTTTANNLSIIESIRRDRGEETDRLRAIISRLG
ncbi:TRAFs-binding domain-containing protein [Pedococcus sp. 5OH_020]|uniref:TRAFs-binding domain-containing protein n=1 Tax=Pedococcus sp. 5OH_020 TaxID=2989814 RepID=UPI0022E9DBC7|nr:TRAFs-binding domain-containing protein [Pedococcus sp. 5OH_020]